MNPAQLGVLRWVAHGCAEARYEGYSHRVSAAALRTRGLIRISGHGTTWRAEITASGRAVLELPEPLPRVKRVPRAALSSRGDRPARVEPKSKPLSKTEQLMADIAAAGGSLLVPYWREDGQPDLRQRAAAAIRFGKVPDGQRLVMTHVSGGKLELRLEADPAGMELAAIAVPARLTKPHPVAGRYRDRTDDHLVSRAAVSRSVRIVHALSVEAERRGYEVSNSESRDRREQTRRSREAVTHLVIAIRGHRYQLSVTEEKVLLRGDWEERRRANEAYRNQLYTYVRTERVKPYDSEATGILSIDLVASGPVREGRPASWRDRKSWTLEDKLPELLCELELRAVEDDQREAEERRQQEERRRRWEQIMEAARERYGETYRANVLREQAAARREARLLSDYLVDLKETHSGSVESSEWIEWIAGFIERLDPLTSPPAMPVVSEPTHEELKALLPQGVSPYGPERW